MTFNPLVPLNGDSPGIFPAQNQTNMTRLKTMIAADHQFNNSAAANDGYHNLIHYNLLGTNPSGALANIGRGYCKVVNGVVQKFYMDDAGIEYQETPTMPIRAAVNFSGVLVTAIRSSYNVASVTYISEGKYKVNFTRAMPDTNYIVQVTAMRKSLNNGLIGCVQGDATYTNSVDTTFVIVNTISPDANFRDALMCNVTVFSVT